MPCGLVYSKQQFPSFRGKILIKLKNSHLMLHIPPVHQQCSLTALLSASMAFGKPAVVMLDLKDTGFTLALDPAYVVFGGLPRRFGVEASWRHGSASRLAERHMVFDLQILWGLLGQQLNWQGVVAVKTLQDLLTLLIPSRKTTFEKTRTPSAKERCCPAPHPSPPPLTWQHVCACQGTLFPPTPPQPPKT